MELKLIEFRLFVICDRCETLEILSTIEEDKELAAEMKIDHMFRLPTHTVEVILLEVEA